MTFDQVLPRLAQTCEGFPGFSSVTRAVAVRDLRGRVRLVVDPAPRPGSQPLPKLDGQALGAALQRELGPWFVLPVVEKGAGGIPASIPAQVIQTAELWAPVWEDVATATRKTSQVPWGKIERHLSKHAWTAGDGAGSPWPLVPRKPAIVTFYSFKGGVGRTTLLASVAWQLARQGRRVLVLDLDVEAPGVGTTLGAQNDRGMLDALVDHAATGSIDLTDLRAAANALGAEAGLVDVIHAGKLGPSYFEKLARLDFGGSATFGDALAPVGAGLRALLEAVAREPPAPDFILLDSRAGLHDIAGLSLHDLAHVDVLVGRDDMPSHQGLGLVLEAVGRRRKDQRGERRRFVTVFSMAPPETDEDVRSRAQAHFRASAFAAFDAHIYDDSTESFGEPDSDADHSPFLVSFDEQLLRFTELRTVEGRLFGDEYRAILDRLQTLCTPESASETDGEASS